MKYLKKVGIIVLILSIYINFVGGTVSLALNDITSKKEIETSNINSEDIESLQNNTTDNSTKDEINKEANSDEDEISDNSTNGELNENEILDTKLTDEIKQEENKKIKSELLEEKKENEQQITTYTETNQNNENETIENSSNQSEKVIETGYYQICTALDLGKVLDVDAASKNNQANVQIWQNKGVRQQQFKVIKLDNGYYEIVNCRSAKALDVEGGKKEKRNECVAIFKKQFRCTKMDFRRYRRWILLYKICL